MSVKELVDWNDRPNTDARFSVKLRNVIDGQGWLRRPVTLQR